MTNITIILCMRMIASTNSVVERAVCRRARSESGVSPLPRRGTSPPPRDLVSKNVCVLHRLPPFFCSQFSILDEPQTNFRIRNEGSVGRGGRGGGQQRGGYRGPNGPQGGFPGPQYESLMLSI